MDPALTEALSALRVLSDPTRAFGANRARGMQAFARAAYERSGGGWITLPEPEGEVLAGPTRHPEHAESWAAVFRQRGIRCAVVKEQSGSVVRCDP